MIYFCSDTHFNHDKDFIWRPRGYNSCQEMNEDIIKNWNECVSKEDDVYLLGDVMLGNNQDSLELVKRLNGKIHIVIGNHDTSNRIKIYETLPNVTEVEPIIILKNSGYIFYLSHYPTITSNYDYDKPLKKKVINLCGHSHTTDRFSDMNKGVIYHVELDAHNNKPVSINTIIKEIEEYENKN